MAAGTRRRAVEPVKTGGADDGTVIALEREDSFQLKQSWVNKRVH